MPRRARPQWPGCPFHITQRGNNRQPVFTDPEDHSTYLRILRHGLLNTGVRILAYALMKNHVHLIAVPPYGDSLSRLFRIVTGTYSRYWNIRHGASGHLWEGRYYSAPMSPTHLHHALRYVELNPVRANLVANPASFPWTSAQAHYSGEDPTQVLDMSYLEDRGGPAAWIHMIEAPNIRTREINHYIRSCTYADRPCGDEDFLKQAELQFGFQYRRWPFLQALASDEVAFRLEHLPD